MLKAEELAQSFIRAYYPIMLYSPSELFKFYEMNASIWRPSFGTKEGKPIQQCFNDLVLKLEPTHTLSLSTYVVNPFGNNISLSVYGFITTETTNTAFVHDFIILQIFTKFFIVSDVFHYFQPDKILNDAKDNVLIPPVWSYIHPQTQQMDQQMLMQMQPQSQPVQHPQQNDEPEKPNSTQEHNDEDHSYTYNHQGKSQKHYYPKLKGDKQPPPRRTNSYNYNKK